MTIYLEIFLFSYVLTCIACRFQKKKILCLFFSLGAILVPSLFAGYRDPTVGHDLMAYAVPSFNAICEIKDWQELSLYYVLTGLEPLYILSLYITTRFTDDIFWFFFAQQVFVLSIVYYVSYKLRDNLNWPLSFLIYLLYVFCFSMSANRQVFAIALVYLSYWFLHKKKLLPFLFVIFIAQGFHSSAIIVLLLYPLNIWLGKNESNYSFKQIYFILAGAALYFLFPIIVSNLISLGIFAEKYARYINADYATHKIELLLALICYLFSFLSNKLTKWNFHIKVYSILIFFIVLCGVYNDIATRASMYLTLFLFLIILENISVLYKSERVFFSILFCSIILFLYIYNAYSTGISESIPYTSKELNIK